VEEVDADVAKDTERCLVDRVELLGVEQFDRRTTQSRLGERGLVGDVPADSTAASPGSPSGRLRSHATRV
jgi:hypothetical protein